VYDFNALSAMYFVGVLFVFTYETWFNITSFSKSDSNWVKVISNIPVGFILFVLYVLRFTYLFSKGILEIDSCPYFGSFFSNLLETLVGQKSLIIYLLFLSLFRHILYLSAYYFRGIRFWYTGVILSWFP
jgi:hypothetical protein